MLLAELEVFHTRPNLPTRRVALGRSLLPVEPPPGFGGLLLGGIVAAHVDELDAELVGDLGRLLDDLEAGRRTPQPRLRHRLQVDHIGLARSVHRLVGRGDVLEFEFDEGGAPAAQVLGAAYAAGQLPFAVRHRVMEALRRALRWQGPVGPALVAHLSGAIGASTWSAAAYADPGGWALEVLGLNGNGTPARSAIQRRFRTLLMDAHPDHGGDRDGAATRIADLTEARRILLAEP